MEKKELNAVIATQLATGSSIIGALTFWGLRGVRVPRTELRAKLESLGLSVPRDPKPSALLRAACEATKRTADGRTVVFDRVADSTRETVIAISVRSIDSTSEEVEYAQATRIRVNKSTGDVTSDDPSNEVIRAVVASYLDLRENMGTDELGSVLAAAIRGRKGFEGLSAVNMRGETGGVYFVPAANVDRLSALALIIDGISGDCSMTVWPIASSDRTIAQAQGSARVDFVARIAEVRAEVQELIATCADGTEQGSRRILARARSFRSIRDRIETYGDLLGDLRSEMEGELGQLQSALETALGAALPTSLDDAE